MARLIVCHGWGRGRLDPPFNSRHRHPVLGGRRDSSAVREKLLVFDLLRIRVLKNPVTDRVFVISYPHQAVDHDGDSSRLGAFHSTAPQGPRQSADLTVGQERHLSSMRGGCDMQVFDYIEKLDLAAVLLIGGAHYLLRLLPLISDRVNARAVRLIEAKNKQDD